MRLWPVAALLLLGAVSAPAAPPGPGDNDATLRKARRYIAGMEKDGLIDRSAEGWRQQVPVYPELAFTAGRTYFWNLETAEGPIRVRLMADVAPSHVSNLIYLSELGYFDGLEFYRIVPGFMAQAGLGKDGPEYFVDHEVRQDVRFDRRGRLAMGVDGPNSAAGLLFLTMRPAPWLDGVHTIFGQLSGGSDTLEALELRGVPVTEPCRPLKIEKAWISVLSTPTETPTDDALRQVRDYIYLKTNMGLIDRENPGRTKILPEFPDLEYTDGATYFWDLQTSLGPIRILLLPRAAPRHVANAIYLSELGFYDGLAFHRVIPDFMAQAGRDKSGAPGYTFELEAHKIYAHDRAGMVSMANTGEPKSDSSEFFITFEPAAWLNQKHTVFGEVAGGMETLEEIEKRGSSGGTTSEPVLIERAVITVE